MKAASKNVLAVTTKEDEITGEVKPLFAFPVDVVKATEPVSVKFDIAGPSGAPRKQQYVDTATGEIITDDQTQKGIRFGDDFKPIAKDTITAIEEAGKINMMRGLGNIPLDEARAEYGDRTTGKYFLQSPSKGGSPKAYRLTYEALLPVVGPKGKVQSPAMAIVTKRTATSQQRLGYVYASEEDKCLVLIEVLPAEAMRAPDAQVQAPMLATVEQAQIDMARKVIATLGDGRVALDTERDEVAAAKKDLIAKALDGQDVKPPLPVAATVESDNLLDALTASLAS